MKKTISGFPAFKLLLSTAVPVLTKTYTPIAHDDIVNRVREEIGKAGFKITKEDYKATGNGQIGIGIYRMEYKFDKSIELLASFMNSYDTSYAFRFTLGVGVKGSDNTMFLCDDASKVYKKFHKGDANVLSNNQISEQFANAGEFWELALQDKDVMCGLPMDTENQDAFFKIITDIYFQDSLLTGYQMGIIKDELSEKHVQPWHTGVTLESLWHYYNCVLVALQESHPATWVSTQKTFHKRVSEIFTLPSYGTGKIVKTESAITMDMESSPAGILMATFAKDGITTDIVTIPVPEEPFMKVAEFIASIDPITEDPKVSVVKLVTTDEDILLDFGNCIIPGSFDSDVPEDILTVKHADPAYGYGPHKGVSLAIGHPGSGMEPGAFEKMFPETEEGPISETPTEEVPEPISETIEEVSPIIEETDFLTVSHMTDPETEPSLGMTEDEFLLIADIPMLIQARADGLLTLKGKSQLATMTNAKFHKDAAADELFLSTATLETLRKAKEAGTLSPTGLSLYDLMSVPQPVEQSFDF